MLRVFRDKDIDEVLEEKVITRVLDGTTSLLRSKQTSLKLLALKIGKQSFLSLSPSHFQITFRKVIFLGFESKFWKEFWTKF